MTRMLCPEPGSFSQAGLALAGRYTELVAERLEQSEFEAAAVDFDAVLIRFNTRVRGDLLAKAPRLKAVLSPTTGLDHIDLAAASRRGVKVFHLKGQNRFLRTVSATAELTITLMLATLRRLPAAIQSTRLGQWDPGPFRGREASGKTLGIVGCGRLGAKVARVGRALNMNVVVYDPFVSRLPAGVVRANSLADLLGGADIVSLHVPLMPETVHLIGADDLALLKDGAILINTSRGAVVDGSALIEHLKSGKLAAAAVDVVEDEEAILLGRRHPLIEYAKQHDNLLITPHIGGATFESVERTDSFILNRYFKDQGLLV